MRAIPSALGFAFLVASFPAAMGGREASFERIFDERGRLIAEVGVDADDTRVGYVRFYHHDDSARGGGKPGGGTDLTDCGSDNFFLGGWRWAAPYDVTTSAHAPQIAASIATWDAATGASIGGSVTSGAAGVAGTYDGVNQIDWVDLGSGGMIAVTTTWYYRSTGEAVESDGQYNTYYAWGTSGGTGVMDVQNIATHEIGHTFGLDHPRGKDVGCLTMYAYGAYGETAKRTLGDGDILSIRALYG